MRNVDEQELRGYLLGSLAPGRRTELQALLREDAALQEQLLAVEAELFDQYVGHCLSELEKELFESHVLTAGDAADKLRFAENFGDFRTTRQLDDLLVHCAPALNFASAPKSAPLFASFYRNPVFAVLLIVFTGLLIALIACLFLTNALSSNLARQASPAVVEIALVPGSTRSDGGMQHLPAPAKNVRVKIELELAKSDYKQYQTQLFRENEALESQEELRSELRSTHYVVPLTVTGEILIPGNYQLKLSGVAESGKPAFIDSYSFRVTHGQLREPELDRNALAR